MGGAVSPLPRNPSTLSTLRDALDQHTHILFHGSAYRCVAGANVGLYTTASSVSICSAVTETLYFEIRNWSLVATHLVVVFLVVVGATLFNQIGMKFGGIVPRGNAHWLMESDFWYDVILSTWRLWRPPAARIQQQRPPAARLLAERVWRHTCAVYALRFLIDSTFVLVRAVVDVSLWIISQLSCSKSIL